MLARLSIFKSTWKPESVSLTEVKVQIALECDYCQFYDFYEKLDLLSMLILNFTRNLFIKKKRKILFINKNIQITSSSFRGRYLLQPLWLFNVRISSIYFFLIYAQYSHIAMKKKKNDFNVRLLVITTNTYERMREIEKKNTWRQIFYTINKKKKRSYILRK